MWAMTRILATKLAATALLALVFCLLPTEILADPMAVFELGAPMVPKGKTVTDTFFIEVYDEVKKTTVSIHIDVPIDSVDSRETKAEKLMKAINNVRDKKGDRYFDANVGGLDRVTGLRDINVDTFRPRLRITDLGMLADNSNEKSGGQLVRPVNKLGAIRGELDYHGALAGVDANRSTSVFQASLIASDAVLASSSILFSNLPPQEQNLDGVLTVTFDQLRAGLAPSLKKDLTLDLQNDRINFAFPGGVANPTVVNFTSDIGTSSSASVQASPEPAGLTLLGIATVTLLCHSWRRRKLAVYRSTITQHG
jgi:hypothetical protein